MINSRLPSGLKREFTIPHSLSLLPLPPFSRRTCCEDRSNCAVRVRVDLRKFYAKRTALLSGGSPCFHPPSSCRTFLRGEFYCPPVGQRKSTPPRASYASLLPAQCNWSSQQLAKFFLFFLFSGGRGRSGMTMMNARTLSGAIAN